MMNEPKEIPADAIMALAEMNRKLHWAITRGIDEPEQDSSDFGDRQGQMRVLHMMARERTLAMTEIAQRMRVSRSTVTGIVRGLLEQGLIERTNDPDDWRVVHATITPSGDALIVRNRQRLFARISKWITEIDEPERSLLLDAVPAMQALSRVLDERLVETGGKRARHP